MSNYDDEIVPFSSVIFDVVCPNCGHIFNPDGDYWAVDFEIPNCPECNCKCKEDDLFLTEEI